VTSAEARYVPVIPVPTAILPADDDIIANIQALA
jgi:hypothetical protein